MQDLVLFLKNPRNLEIAVLMERLPVYPLDAVFV